MSENPPTHIGTALSQITGELAAAAERPRVPCSKCGAVVCLDTTLTTTRLCEVCDEKISTAAAERERKLLAIKRINESGLPELFRGVTFDTYIAKNLNPDIVPLAITALNPHSKGLLLIGPAGIGKTLITAAMITRWCHQGYTPLFISGRELKTKIEKSRFDAKTDLVREIAKHEIVVIDDLTFTEQPDRFAQDEFNRLIDTLYGKRQKKLVITTNLPVTSAKAEPSLLLFFGTPFVSRLAELCTIKNITGSDLRLKK